MCGIGFGINVETSTFSEIKNRGPDESTYLLVDNHTLVFHRLKINGLSSGNQPFFVSNEQRKVYCMVNGEIYNYKEIQEKEKFDLKTLSDCEVVPHLYLKYKHNFVNHLVGEFAIVILEQRYLDGKYRFLSIRDHVGVRPLFYGKDENKFGICSEAKGLLEFNQISVLEPRTFLTSNWYKKDFPEISIIPQELSAYFDRKMYGNFQYISTVLSENSWEKKLQENLSRAVKQRLLSDRPLGALLSGGVDSSLVCALAARELKKEGKQLNVFTISLPNSTDLPFAKIVAEHIGAKHHIVNITTEEALHAIDETIYAIESFDTTTVRASVMQFLISKWIKENTDIRVLLVGEMSDELFNGYLYSHFITGPFELRQDAVRLVNEIHYFDGLRTDRTCAYHGIEVRLPFSDYQLIIDVLHSELKKTVPVNGVEKHFLRKVFTDLLPEQVLWRKKEAFSDACSSKEKSWYQIIQEEIDKRVSDEEFNNRPKKLHMNPMTKEQYYYRKVFESKFGSKCEKLIPHFWVPKNVQVENNEPSARVYS